MSFSENDILLKSAVLGPLQTNCYLIGYIPTQEAVLIDSGAVPLSLLKLLQVNELSLKYALLTHAHFDHIQGIGEVQQMTGCQVVMHKSEEAILKSSQQAAIQWGFKPPTLQKADMFITDGGQISVGELTLEVLHTPGHTPGGLSFYSEQLGVVFAGDTLFMQSIGRTDFPGGSFETLLSSIRTRLLVLPGETRVAPGHGPTTTISQEKRSNPFL